MATDDKNQGSKKEIKAKGQSRDDERQPKRRAMRIVEDGVKTLHSGALNTTGGSYICLRKSISESECDAY